MLKRFVLFALLLTAWSGMTGLAAAQDAEPESDKSAEVASNSDVDGNSADEADKHAGDDAHKPDDGHESGDAHSVTDTTHANMSDAGLDLVEFRMDMAFFTAVVFLVLLAGLLKFAWKPIMDGLEKREQGIAGNIRKAAQDAQSAAAKLAEYETKLSAANEEAQAIVAEARKDAEATGQKLVAAAQEEAVRLQERSATEIESAKRVALNEVAGQSTTLAMSVARRVVGREVNADDHNSMIQEMLSKLPSEN